MRTPDEFKDWFIDYTKPFIEADRDPMEPVRLKVEHSLAVMGEMRTLARALTLSPEQVETAAILGVLHDAGRFIQLKDFGTWVDSASMDHGDAGKLLLEKTNLLHALPSGVRENILTAVSQHNKAVIPDGLAPEALFWTKLIRDADKLDIFERIIEAYRTKRYRQDSTVTLGTKDTPGFSEDVLQLVMQREVVPYRILTNLNDFRILQMGWMYDLNFLPAIRIAKERNVLRRLRSYISSDDPRIDGLVNEIQEYMDHCLLDGKLVAPETA